MLLADTQFHGPIVFVLLDGGIGPDAHVQVTILRRLPEKLHVPTVQQVVAPGNKHFLWQTIRFICCYFTSACLWSIPGGLTDFYLVNPAGIDRNLYIVLPLQSHRSTGCT